MLKKDKHNTVTETVVEGFFIPLPETPPLRWPQAG